MTAVTPAPVVAVSVWRLPPRAVPGALVRVASARASWSATPGLVFGKLLGTAGRRFTPADARPGRWVMLTAWSDPDAAARFERSPRLRWWDQHAVESCALLMRPVWSRGSWDGRQPFGEGGTGEAWDGPVVALTRSTLRARTALRFYRAVPAVARDVATSDGLRAALAIGERPVLRQGTLSVWDSTAAMREFAHGTSAHVAAIRATPTAGWYAEELFARFALVAATGSIDGRPVAA